MQQCVLKFMELISSHMTYDHMIIVYLFWRLSSLDTEVFCCQGRFSMLLHTSNSLFKNQDMLEALLEGATVRKTQRY